MTKDNRTIEQKSLHFLTMIAETLETSNFTAQDVQKYLGHSEPDHQECLLWLRQEGYVTAPLFGFGSHRFTEQGDLFVNLVAL